MSRTKMKTKKKFENNRLSKYFSIFWLIFKNNKLLIFAVFQIIMNQIKEINGQVKCWINP